MNAVYPGSFDPVTLGHLDIIWRAARAADKLTVVVVENASKKPMFGTEDRMRFLRDELKDLTNVTVDSFAGMFADYVLRQGFDLIIRGARGAADFEYESVMAVYNRALTGGVDTWVVTSNPGLAHISSSAVREVAALVAQSGRGADVLASLVPKGVSSELISVASIENNR